MKLIHSAISLLAVAAFAGTISSCATSTAQIDESVAINSGFKTVTPKTAKQKALLATLPTDQLTPITHAGKQYYVIPNLAKTQAYVGGPKQLEKYEDLQVGEAISDAELSEASLVADAADWGWGDWDNWDGVATPAWY